MGGDGAWCVLIMLHLSLSLSLFFSLSAPEEKKGSGRQNLFRAAAVVERMDVEMRPIFYFFAIGGDVPMKFPGGGDVNYSVLQVKYTCS